MRRVIFVLLLATMVLQACAPSQQDKNVQLPVWIPGGPTKTTEWRKWNNYFVQILGDRVLSVASLEIYKSAIGSPIITITSGIRVTPSSVGATCRKLVYKGLLNDTAVVNMIVFAINLPHRDFDSLSISIAKGLTAPKDIAEFGFNAETLCLDYDLSNLYKLPISREQVYIPLQKDFNFAGFGDIRLSTQAQSADLSVNFLPSGKVSLLEMP